MLLAGWALCALALVSPACAGEVTAGDVKRACDRAANWLIEQHNLGAGTFGKGKLAQSPGVVALVIKALAGSPRQYREPHGPFMTQPVKYLLSTQQDSGAFMQAGHDTYNTALAVLALQALQNKNHDTPIDQGRLYLAKCQTKDGGFTYGDGFRHGGDLSNTWFGLSGLRTAGGKREDALNAKAVVFIRRCQDNLETNPDIEARQGENSGGAYYKPGASEVGTLKTRTGAEVPKPYGSMTAAALDAYLHAGLKADAPEVKAALRWFSVHFSAKENPGAGATGYFYYTWAVSRALAAAGVKEIDLAAAEGKPASKVNWAKALAEQLLEIQDKATGSFVNKDSRWGEDDAVLCTAYTLQSLSQCYQVLSAK